MGRREFLMALGGAVVAGPHAALAQQAKIFRIGFLWESPTVFPDSIEAFRQGLRDLGYVEGRTIAIEYRWAEGNPERMRELAEELVRLNVDVIMVPSSVYTAAAKRATSTIPIVFMGHADPLGSGHVTSLAHPGGNITGLSLMMTETNVKGLELLKQVVPGLLRVAVMFDPATPSHGPGLKAIEAAAQSLGLSIQSVPVGSAEEYESAFSSMVRERADAVLVLSTPPVHCGSQAACRAGDHQ
jgi:putative tryptophan/tyrosine transport system substrate-binding protein